MNRYSPTFFLVFQDNSSVSGGGESELDDIDSSLHGGDFSAPLMGLDPGLNNMLDGSSERVCRWLIVRDVLRRVLVVRGRGASLPSSKISGKISMSGI